jgi:hypothetical protein
MPSYRVKEVALEGLEGTKFYVGERDSIFEVKELLRDGVVAVILRNCTALIFDI